MKWKLNSPFQIVANGESIVGALLLHSLLLPTVSDLPEISGEQPCFILVSQSPSLCHSPLLYLCGISFLLIIQQQTQQAWNSWCLEITVYHSFICSLVSYFLCIGQQYLLTTLPHSASAFRLPRIRWFCNVGITFPSSLLGSLVHVLECSGQYRQTWP